jgi:hypothetical protein
MGTGSAQVLKRRNAKVSRDRDSRRVDMFRTKYCLLTLKSHRDAPPLEPTSKSLLGEPALVST